MHKGLLILVACLLLTPAFLMAQSGTEESATSIFENFDGNGSVTISQDKQLENLVNRHAQSNGERKGISGYRIQIYSGSGSNARSEALKIQAAFIRAFPDIESTLMYIEPSFRLRVGNFRTKAEGFPTYKRIIELYPQCYFVIEKEMDFPALPE
ncbi:MAG: hypothetical protein K9I34_06825 [Bacteroidales bacterium]|nr:hypothetical protein [Bacteroidales bacterium]